MKKTTWWILIALWLIFLTASMYWILKPFFSQKKLRPTDFMADSVKLVAIIPVKDSFDYANRLTFIPTYALEKLKKMHAFFSTYTDTVWMACYSLKSDAWLYILKATTTRKFPELPGYIQKEKFGWILLSQQEKLIQDALKIAKNKHNFSPISAQFGTVDTITFFVKSNLLSSQHEVIHHIRPSDWVKISYGEDSSKIIEQWAFISTQKGQEKNFQSWDEFSHFIPAYSEEWEVKYNNDDELSVWRNIIQETFSAPFGWFNSPYDSIVYFATIGEKKSFPENSRNYEINAVFSKDHDSLYKALWQQKIFWSKSKASLKNALEQIISNNTISARLAFVKLNENIDFPLISLHVDVKEPTLVESLSIRWNLQVYKKVFYKKRIDDGYMLPSHKKKWVIQLGDEAILAIWTPDSMMYFFYPNQWMVKRIPGLIPEPENIKGYKNKSNEKLYVWWNKNKLAYLADNKKENVIELLDIKTEDIQDVAALPLNEPIRWNLLVLSKQGSLYNLQLPGRKTNEWRLIKLPFSGGKILRVQEHDLLIEDETNLYIFSFVGKKLKKIQFNHLHAFSENAFVFLKNAKTLGIFSNKKLTFLTLPFRMKNPVGLGINEQGEIFLYTHEQVYFKSNGKSWQNITLPLKGNGNLKTLFLLGNSTCRELVLLQKDTCYLLKLDGQTLKIEKQINNIENIFYSKPHVWGITKNNVLIYIK